MIVVFILSALWWIRIRGLWKIPDRRDWLRGKWVLFWWAGPCSISQFSRSFVSDSVTTWTAVRQASLSITNSWSLLKLMSIELVIHLTISSSVVPFSCLQSFPASGSFQMSQFFASGSQSIGVSASASVLLMNIQDWFPLGWTGWISLQSKGLSRVFSNTIVQKHQFFGTQPSSQSNSHIHTYYWKNHSFD